MKKVKVSTLRTLTAIGVVAVACVGLAVHTGLGTPSSFGWNEIAALCPLGAVEAAIASKTIVPPLLIGAAIAVAITLLVGRAFCAWGCPVPLLRRIFGMKDEKRTKAKAPAETDPASEKSTKTGNLAKDALRASQRGGLGDSRNWVLGGAVLSTAIVGFPVFCLICPVGLTFATVVAVWKLFQFSDFTLSLLVFPAMLVLEVVVLRKWCHKFCPIGALLSLIARANRTFQPTVNAASCIHERGTTGCNQCASACPEGIDLHAAARSAPMHECTRCHSCADACPTKSVTFPFLKKAASETAVYLDEEVALDS